MMARLIVCFLILILTVKILSVYVIRSIEGIMDQKTHMPQLFSRLCSRSLIAKALATLFRKFSQCLSTFTLFKVRDLALDAHAFMQR